MARSGSTGGSWGQLGLATHRLDEVARSICSSRALFEDVPNQPAMAAETGAGEQCRRGWSWEALELPCSWAVSRVCRRRAGDVCIAGRVWGVWRHGRQQVAA